MCLVFQECCFFWERVVLESFRVFKGLGLGAFIFSGGGREVLVFFIL